jgi:hypothetical protein
MLADRTALKTANYALDEIADLLIGGWGSRQGSMTRPEQGRAG